MFLTDAVALILSLFLGSRRKRHVAGGNGLWALQTEYFRHV